MLNLIEMLPEEHKELLTVYMQHYSEAGKYYCGNDVFLNEWAKNKKGLYQLLGGFTKTIPFKCEKETRIIKSELYTLVSNSAFFTSILYISYMSFSSFLASISSSFSSSSNSFRCSISSSSGLKCFFLIFFSVVL